MSVSGFYAGICGIILALLVLNIVRKRMIYKVGLGDGGIADLQQAMRIHGNFVEMVPFSLILLVLLEYNGFSLWLMHAYGCGLLIARGLHAYGLLSTPYRSFGRTIGIIINLLLFFIASMGLIGQYLEIM